MGNTAQTSTSVPPGDHDLDQVNRKPVQDFAVRTYAVGIALWVLIWVAGFWSLVRKAPFVLLGAFFGLAVLVLNLLTCRSETIGTYEVENAELRSLEGNSFYVSAALFAFGSFIMAVPAEAVTVRRALPLLMLCLFATVCVVLAPVWTSTVDPIDTIKTKHIKTVSTIYGIALLTATLALVFFYKSSPDGHLCRRYAMPWVKSNVPPCEAATSSVKPAAGPPSPTLPQSKA